MSTEDASVRAARSSRSPAACACKLSPARPLRHCRLERSSPVDLAAWSASLDRDMRLWRAHAETMLLGAFFGASSEGRSLWSDVLPLFEILL